MFYKVIIHLFLATESYQFDLKNFMLLFFFPFKRITLLLHRWIKRKMWPLVELSLQILSQCAIKEELCNWSPCKFLKVQVFRSSSILVWVYILTHVDVLDTLGKQNKFILMHLPLMSIGYDGSLCTLVTIKPFLMNNNFKYLNLEWNSSSISISKVSIAILFYYLLVYVELFLIIWKRLLFLARKLQKKYLF